MFIFSIKEDSLLILIQNDLYNSTQDAAGSQLCSSCSVGLKFSAQASYNIWTSVDFIVGVSLVESQNGWGWNGTLEVIWSNSPVQAASPRTGCPGLCPDSFWISPRIETLQPSWTACTRAQSPAEQKMSPYVQTEPPVFQVLPITSSVTGYHSAWLSFFTPFLEIFVHIDAIPHEPSLV